MDRRLDDVERWRDEIRGALGLIKWIFGLSMISALLSAVSLLVTLGHQ